MNRLIYRIRWWLRRLTRYKRRWFWPYSEARYWRRRALQYKAELDHLYDWRK